ncbi:sensor histidine kinase, partial [Mycobacterium montefiorense]
TSLEAIERSSRAAASDLHRQLDLLHGKDIDGHRQPSIANLDQVLETVRGAGLEVKADIDTVPPSLEQSLDIVVYRIAQELLTNALKYGEGCALLTIKMTDTQIDIVQKNSMPSTMAEDRVSAGRGLAGINQRVSIFGGVFEFGSDRSTSTWWATATIPLGEW